MKTPRLPCFGLLLLVGSMVGIMSANAEWPAPSEQAELRTFPSEAPFGKFDGHGKLFYQVLYQDDVPADWHSTFTYYPRGSHKAYKLQRNLRSINVFLAAEIRRPSTVRTFLNEYLGHFLLDNFADDGTIPTASNAPSIITSTDADSGLGSDPDGMAHISAAQRARLKMRIQRYARPSEPVIEGNGWTLDINVLINDGAVEHWVAKGRVTPLQIDSFLCEPKEPAGTFYPVRASY